MKHNVDDVISFSKELFNPVNNEENRYYEWRERFNTSTSPLEKAVLLLWLNRHCYNGLMRYSGSENTRKFNVPFGKYKNPYFPEEELSNLSRISQRATFICADHRDVLAMVKKGDVVLADPPYLKRQKNGFTHYAGRTFSKSDHVVLTEFAETQVRNNVTTAIFNHDIAQTRELYSNATYRRKLNVRRPVNRNAHQRSGVQEVMAVYSHLYSS